MSIACRSYFFFFQAEDGIRDLTVTGVQTCALPISPGEGHGESVASPAPRRGSRSRLRSLRGAAMRPLADVSRDGSGARLQVLLLTEGTYPYHFGGVSTWCNSLVQSLPDVRFTVMALV